MKMTQHCPYASNPYHDCNKYCSRRPPRSKVLAVDENLGPKDVGVEDNGEEEGRRDVDPLCSYSSNPYHKCTDFCIRRNPNQKSSLNGAKSGPKDVGVEDNGDEEGRRDVDPLCGYSSNPYHKCTDLCIRRNPNQKSSLYGAKSIWWSNMVESRKGASFILPFISSEGRKERVMTVNTNNVNPSCSYASNPYHQCTNNCSQSTKEMIEIKQGRSSRYIGVPERKSVDSGCKYASNPYHKCASYCSLKINQVA